MHQQPRTMDPPGKPKSSSRSLHVCSVSGRTSNMAAVWHSAAHGTRPRICGFVRKDEPLPTYSSPASVALCGKTWPSTPSVALCGETHPTLPKSARICGFVRKDAAVDPICGLVRRETHLTLPRSAPICGLVRED